MSATIGSSRTDGFELIHLCPQHPLNEVPDDAHLIGIDVVLGHVACRVRVEHFGSGLIHGWKSLHAFAMGGSDAWAFMFYGHQNSENGTVKINLKRSGERVLLEARFAGPNEPAEDWLFQASYLFLIEHILNFEPQVEAFLREILDNEFIASEARPRDALEVK